jgi:hypothetical protein
VKPTTFVPGKDRKTARAIDPPKRPNPTTVTCFKFFKIKTLRKCTHEKIPPEATAWRPECQFFSLIHPPKMVAFAFHGKTTTRFELIKIRI